MIATKER